MGRDAQTEERTMGVDGPRHHVSLPLSSFVGREGDLPKLARLLRTNRLLTLTGIDGVGKTRLALEAAARVEDAFADGVAFVALAPVADAALVAPTIAQVLGLRTTGREPPLDALAHALRDRHLLLILDNLEHLLGAAPSLMTLVESCPRLSLLVTSRERLRLRGEQLFVVPPLAVPAAAEPSSPDALGAVPAVALFVERARAIALDFALTAENAAEVAEICRRLDGLPLALELAAARVNVLSVRQLAVRLGDRFRVLASGSRTGPPRHQTLRATLDWSYELLTDGERRLLGRLSVFAGGFSLEAAEAVGGDLTPPAPLPCEGRGVTRSTAADQPPPLPSQGRGAGGVRCPRPAGCLG